MTEKGKEIIEFFRKNPKASLYFKNCKNIDEFIAYLNDKGIKATKDDFEGFNFNQEVSFEDLSNFLGR